MAVLRFVGMKVNLRTLLRPFSSSDGSDEDSTRKGASSNVRGISNPPIPGELSEATGTSTSRNRYTTDHYRGMEGEASDYFQSMCSGDEMETDHDDFRAEEDGNWAYEAEEEERRSEAHGTSGSHVQKERITIGRVVTNEWTITASRSQATRRLTRSQGRAPRLEEDRDSEANDIRWNDQFHRKAFMILRGKIVCPQHKNRVCKYTSQGIGNNCFRFKCKEGRRTFSMTEPQAVWACEENFGKLMEDEAEFFGRYARTWTPFKPAENPREKTSGYNVSARRAMKSAGSSKRRKRAIEQFSEEAEGSNPERPKGLEDGIWLTSEEVYSLRMEVAKLPTYVRSEVNKMTSALNRLAQENQTLLRWKNDTRPSERLALSQGPESEFSLSPISTDCRERERLTINADKDLLAIRTSVPLDNTESREREIAAIYARVDLLASKIIELESATANREREILVTNTKVDLLEKANCELARTVENRERESMACNARMDLLMNKLAEDKLEMSRLRGAVTMLVEQHELNKEEKTTRLQVEALYSVALATEPAIETRVSQLENYMQQSIEAIQSLMWKMCNIDGTLARGEKSIDELFASVSGELRRVALKGNESKNNEPQQKLTNEEGEMRMEVDVTHPQLDPKTQIRKLEETVRELCRVCLPKHNYTAEVSFPDEDTMITPRTHREELEPAPKIQVSKEHVESLIGTSNARMANLEGMVMAYRQENLGECERAQVGRLNLIRELEELLQKKEKRWTEDMDSMGNNLKEQETKLLSLEATRKKPQEKPKPPPIWTEHEARLVELKVQQIALRKELDEKTGKNKSTNDHVKPIQELSKRVESLERLKDGEPDRTGKLVREGLRTVPSFSRVEKLESSLQTVQDLIGVMAKRVTTIERKRDTEEVAKATRETQLEVVKVVGKQIAKEVMVQPTIKSNETKTPQTKRPEERSEKGETPGSSRTKELVVTRFERKEKGSAEPKPPAQVPDQPKQVGKDNRSETLRSGKPPVGTTMLKKPAVKPTEEAKGKSEVLPKSNRKPNPEPKTVEIMGDTGEKRNDAQALGGKEPVQKPTLASIVATKVSTTGPIKTQPPQVGDWTIMVRGEKMDAKKIAVQWERQERLLRVL